jgi:hypothetical protein
VVSQKLRGNRSERFFFSECLSVCRFRLFKPDAPRAHKFIIGNPIALKQMVMYDMGAALHAPWDFLLVEQDDKGTEIIFDLPTATMRSETGGKGLDEEAAKLEEKFKGLVESWL